MRDRRFKSFKSLEFGERDRKSHKKDSLTINEVSDICRKSKPLTAEFRVAEEFMVETFVFNRAGDIFKKD